MTLMRLEFLRSSFVATSALTLSLFAFAACDTADTNTTDPRPVCPPDAGTDCIGPTGGGTNTSGGGSSGNGGAGGSSATNDVTGKVAVLDESSFSQASPFIGTTTIHTTSAAGMPIETQYGDMMPSFSLADVMNGSTWFFVEDKTLGATGIYSTFSILNIPTGSPVTLPVVDRNLVTSIAGMLPSPITVDPSQGVLVLKVIRNGLPLAGVTLTTPPSGATLAYDIGVGLYSNQVQETGQAGVILVFNVNGPSNPELQMFTLKDVNQQAYVIPVKVQAGAATFAGFSL